jgi:tRNA threonylcarbamoyladenosine biosynthesis protein TsaE
MSLVARTFLADEAATLAYAQELLGFIQPGTLVFLRGELGAGKTTLVRGILRQFGHTGSVKSPTYTLVEPYETNFGCVYHFDFYRIADSRELEFIGVDELLDSDAVKFVEWAERAADRLPPPDLEIALKVENAGRTISVYQPDQ